MNANPYQSQAVQTAGPAQLVMMCYDGAITAIDRARSALDDGRSEVANRQLIRAQDIVTELQVTLDRDRGGQIATHLDALYTFCLERLLDANLRKDAGPLATVIDTLDGLRTAWEQACLRTPVGIG